MAKDYDPKKVTCTYAGHTFEGYADGTFITVSRNNQMWTAQVGASGEGARSKSNDRSGTVELSLMMTSKSNDFLSARAALDELNGSGKGVLGILDENGTTIVGATEAWVQQIPSMEYGKELSERTWVLETTDLEIFIGGTD